MKTLSITTFLSFVLSAASLFGSGNASAVCAPDPVLDAETVAVTNERTYYLSEIGGCKNLICWLDNVSGTQFSNATLVLDQFCTLNQTVVIPPRMVIAGVGMDGEGILSFEGLGSAQAAIAVMPGPSTAGVTIRDLRIVGDDPLRGRGIELDSAHQVVMERVRISGFEFGIYGHQSYSVVIDKANLHGNNVNIFQDFTANTWRVTNSVLNQAVRWGIYQTIAPDGTAHQNSSVYSNNRLESNGLGGIHVAGVGTVIQSNEFEGNGGAANVAIQVHSAAVDTRILSNFYSGDCPIDAGLDTQSAFNVYFFAACSQ